MHAAARFWSIIMARHSITFVFRHDTSPHHLQHPKLSGLSLCSQDIGRQAWKIWYDFLMPDMRVDTSAKFYLGANRERFQQCSQEP